MPVVGGGQCINLHLCVYTVTKPTFCLGYPERLYHSGFGKGGCEVGQNPECVPLLEDVEWKLKKQQYLVVIMGGGDKAKD